MRVLVYNVYYYPSQNYGGPATSMRNIVSYCGNDVEFYIVALNHDFEDSTVYSGIQPGWNNVEKAKVLYLKDSEYNKNKLVEIMDEIKPSVIWLSGIWSLLTPTLTNAAIKRGVGVLMSPRGALNEAAVHLKAYKKMPFLLIERLFGVYKNTYFHVTGEGEYDGTKKYLNIPDERIYNIKNLPSFALETSMIEKEQDKLKIAYVSRVNPTKNLLFAINCVNKLKSQVIFDVYGPAEDKGYFSKCEKAISEAPENVTIVYHGAIEPDEVANVYRNHHCSLLPTLTENYGHAIVESMLNGCPAVISKGTTPWDAIDGKSGFVVDLNNPSGFCDALERIASMGQEEYNVLRKSTRKSIVEELQTDKIAQQYLNMIYEIGEKNNET